MLQPGAYELRLTLKEEYGSGFPLGAEKGTLSSATPRVELSVPPLYPLAVRCAAGTRVHLRTGDRFRQSVLVRTVPDDGVLRVDLPAGRYTVQSGRSRVDVDLPGRAEK